MLHLHYSNQTEQLFAALSIVISTPLKNIFEAETILVQSQGMARWLSQHIAYQQGIAANLNFPLPAGFMWSLFSTQFNELEKASSFDADALQWRIFQLLPLCKDQPGFEQINHYLDNGESDKKLWQLSKYIATTFDQYLVYRPKLIMAWENGEHDYWQALLWRQLKEQSADAHWPALLKQFSQIDTEGKINVQALPERISLFAISALSPGYLEVLSVLAKYIEVHLFILNPSFNYWGDIVSDKGLARLRQYWAEKKRPDVSDLYTVGNPLLASMAQQSRDFLDLLHEFNANEYEYFFESEPVTLLSNIQSDILNLQSRGVNDELPRIELIADPSVQIHHCHSAMREVQVLYDELLKAFDENEDLFPDDIIIITPDIKKMAPFIDAVFSTSPESRRIPYNVVDQNKLIDHPVIEVLMSWLALDDERFTVPTVMSWLALDTVKNRFELNNGNISQIHQWVSEAGIRWGLSAEHKEGLGLPDENLNTWRFGLQRLFLGYAMPVRDELFNGCLPYAALEGTDLITLGQLQHFIDELIEWRELIKRPMTVFIWQKKINAFIEKMFLAEDDEQQIINSIYTAIDVIVEQATRAKFDAQISSAIFADKLLEQLNKASSHLSMLDGRINFCDFSLMRSIPFSKVCMLGMNDKAFPMQQHALGFDLIKQSPQKGDRSRREDDRYLFMEAMLSARDSLYISYVARDPRDNSERYPSVLVSELEDYIYQGYQFSEQKIKDCITIKHPLQAFSSMNFQLGSYANEWLVQSEKKPAFIKGKLAVDEIKQIMVSELLLFYKNAAQGFLKGSLGINAAEYNDTLSEEEAFDLGGLESFKLKEIILNGILSDKSTDAVYAQQLAKGLLPHGHFSSLIFNEQLAVVEKIVDKIKPLIKEEELTLEIRLDIKNIKLKGYINYRENIGLIRYRAAKLKSVNQLLLWIEHLIYCAMHTDCHESRYIAIDKVISYQAVKSDHALALLKPIITYYLNGQKEPLHLFPESSLAYAKKWYKDRDVGKALKAAETKWLGSDQYPGEYSDPWYDQAFRNQEIFNTEFIAIVEQIFIPMLEHGAK